MTTPTCSSCRSSGTRTCSLHAPQSNRGTLLHYTITSSLIDLSTKYSGQRDLPDDQKKRILEFVTQQQRTNPNLDQPLTNYMGAGIRTGSNPLQGINPEERITFPLWESFQSAITRISQTDFRQIRSLVFDEDAGFHPTNQSMEYFCGYQQIEEIWLSDEDHTVTKLPVWYLLNLKVLFICDDKHVVITDDDLAYLPNLEHLELSHNNQITNKGISYLKNLRALTLYSNTHVTRQVLQTNPNLKVSTKLIDPF